MPTDMKLPELGENIEGGDVLRVMVKAGDAIKKDQPVLELETDKATIEVPSSADGVVKEVKVKAGREGQGRPDDFRRRRKWCGCQRRCASRGRCRAEAGGGQKADAKAEAAPAEAPKADAKTGDTAAARKRRPPRKPPPHRSPCRPSAEGRSGKPTSSR